MQKDKEIWYQENHLLYESLAESISRTLKTLMTAENISFVDVPYRLKTKKSFLDKWQKKSDAYSCVEDMTDIAGIRIITLVDSDLDKVAEIIEKTFRIHKDDSVNKSELLGSDKFGYRSIHFVCDIGDVRERLPEYKPFKNLCFEIQIRTALSHAWAEIEHDRGYKLGGELPTKLKRRFNLLSGLLESADIEFNRLTKEVEGYKNELKSSSIKDILHHEINKLSLLAYLNLKISDLGYDPKEYSIELFNRKNSWVYFILRDFNIVTIKDLDDIWDNTFDIEKKKIFLEEAKGLHNLINRLLFSNNPDCYLSSVKRKLEKRRFPINGFQQFRVLVGDERFDESIKNSGIEFYSLDEDNK